MEKKNTATSKSKQKPQQLWCDAAYCYCTFLFLQLCKCVIVLSDYIVCILYRTRKHDLQSREHNNHYSKINTIQKPPSCFKMNRKKPSSTRWTLLYIKLLWTLQLFCRCQLLWHTWDFTRIVFKLAKLVVLATMMECLFIPVVTFFGLTVTWGCRPTLWHHLVSWWVPLKRGPLNWVT